MFQPLTPAHRADYLALVQAFYTALTPWTTPFPCPMPEATFDAHRPWLALPLAGYPLPPRRAGRRLRPADEDLVPGGRRELVVWLDELYIAPAFQGHGLGSAFLRRAAGPLPQRRPPSAWR